MRSTLLTDDLSPTVRRFLAWSGPLFVLMAFPGFVMAGLMPPMAPDASVAEVARHWTEHADVRRAGLVLMMLGATLQVPFAALLAVRMKQMEGRWSPLTYMMIAGSAAALLAITVPAFFFAAAAFRVDRDPSVIQLAHDFGWIPFVMNTPPALLQCGALALAILTYRGPRPVLPRWVGFYNLWTAFLFLPGGLCLFFMDGVLAWDGLLSYWIVATLFGSWFFVMAAVLLRWPAREADVLPTDDVPAAMPTATLSSA